MPISPGITFIKSPKGTGKTFFLKNLINDLKKQKKRILLVGHRQLLLQESSKKLGLECYLIGNKAVGTAKRHYAISVDSLANRDLISPLRNKYDVVIVDESEQVFAHFVSETLKERRRLAYFTLQHYLSTASIIVVLDADLNAITVEATSTMMPGKTEARLVLNEYQIEGRSLDVYANEKHLLSDLFEAIRRGERCFVASNSKSRIDKLDESIRELIGPSIKLYKFTSANSMEDETIAKVREIKTEILKHQVILASPSLGTGVDIVAPAKFI